MEYSADRIRELARVARIALTDAEVERFKSELGALHAFADVLENVPECAVAEDPFADAVALSDLRPDEVGECLSHDALPTKDLTAQGYIRVARAVEESV